MVSDALETNARIADGAPARPFRTIVPASALAPAREVVARAFISGHVSCAEAVSLLSLARRG